VSKMRRSSFSPPGWAASLFMVYIPGICTLVGLLPTTIMTIKSYPLKQAVSMAFPFVPLGCLNPRLWVLGPLSEIGFRFFLYPKMLTITTKFQAAVMIGCFYFIWSFPFHAASYWGWPISGSVYSVLAYLIICVAKNIYSSHLWLLSRGNVLVSIIGEVFAISMAQYVTYFTGKNAPTRPWLVVYLYLVPIVLLGCVSYYWSFYEGKTEEQEAIVPIDDQTSETAPGKAAITTTKESCAALPENEGKEETKKHK